MTDEAAGEPTAFDAFEADVGVLCIHGIGLQEQGDTLMAIAPPLLEALADGGDWNVHETVLKPLRALNAEPAYLRAAVDTKRHTLNVLMAESWWADAFPPPSYGDLTRWLLSYGTWILVRHLVFRLATPIRALRQAVLDKWHTTWTLVEGIDYLYGLAATACCMFLVIPVQFFFLSLGALSWLPVPAVRSAAKRLMMLCSGVIGDANVFASNPVIHQAILTRVRTDLEWLLARGKVVVILAHSQGAAVAFDLLRSTDDLSRIRLVTYGSGVRKLTELERDAGRTPWAVRVSALLWLHGALLGFLGWQGARYLQNTIANPDGNAGHGWLALVYTGLLLLVFGMLYVEADQDEPLLNKDIEAAMKGLLDKRLEWVDLYASSDPVPGGPLLLNQRFPVVTDGWRSDPDQLPGFRDRRVTNRNSTLSDHTSYWQVPNDFVPNVAIAISSWLSRPQVVAGPNAWRVWRVRLRKVGVLGLMIAAVAVYVRARDPWSGSLVRALWDAMVPDASSTIGRVARMGSFRPTAEYAGGALVYAAIAWTYARLVVEPTWNAWERAVQRRPIDVSGFRPVAAFFWRWEGRTASWRSALLCGAVVGVPAAVLIDIAWTSSLAGSTFAVIVVAEALVTVLAWGMIGLLAVTLVAGAIIRVSEWFSARRRPRDQ